MVAPRIHFAWHPLHRSAGTDVQSFWNPRSPAGHQAKSPDSCHGIRCRPTLSAEPAFKLQPPSNTRRVRLQFDSIRPQFEAIQTFCPRPHRRPCGLACCPRNRDVIRSGLSVAVFSGRFRLYPRMRCPASAAADSSSATAIGAPRLLRSTPTAIHQALAPPPPGLEQHGP